MTHFPGLAPIISGPDSAQALAEELEGAVLLVTDEGIKGAGLVEQLPSADWELYLQGPGEPKDKTVDKLAEHLRQASFDWVVGLGGGSVLDVVKLAACVAEGAEPTEHYQECRHPLPRAGVKRALLPTTAGTGSEVTRTAIFTDERGHKTWAWGAEIGADLVVLDASLTLGLPHKMTCLTSLDAAAHALESYLSPKASPFVESFCLQSLSLVGAALRAVLKSGQHVEARQDLLLASMLAGVGIDLCGTGIAHAGSHAAGTAVGSGHAEGVVWAMPAAYEWNKAAAAEKYSKVAALLEPGETDFGRAWKRLVADCGSLPKPQGLSSEALSTALLEPENRPMLDNNPQSVNESDIAQLTSYLLENS